MDLLTPNSGKYIRKNTTEYLLVSLSNWLISRILIINKYLTAYLFSKTGVAPDNRFLDKKNKSFIKVAKVEDSKKISTPCGCLYEYIEGVNKPI